MKRPWIVEQIAAFGADNLPDLVLEDEDGNEIHSDGKPIVFGTTYWPNGGETRSFTVRNAGSGILDGLALEWEGGDIGDFILSPLTTDSIAAVSDLTFSVTFDPSSKSVGDFVVHLVLKSSDGDEPVIRMVLTGDRENRDPEFEVGIEGAVQVIVPLPDGRILVGGGPFERADGNSAGRLARLYSDGSLDLGFRPNFDNSVACASYLQDGSILVGGPFTSIDGVTCNHIARLTTEGVVDPSFQPDADDAIGGILPLADGAILVSGVFTSIGGIYQAKLARLFPDGSVDSAFDPAIDGAVGSCVVQADGKIVIGGSFQNVNGVPRNRMARLHPDGSLDMTFDPNVNGSLNVLAVQPDGRILLGGSFTAVGGTTRNRAARLFADGSLDPSFDPNFSGAVESMVLQSDGALTVSGSFYSVGGVSSGSLVRFDPAGNWNPSFPTQSIGILALQRDGRLLGGGYTLRRMLNDTVAEESLGQNGVADIQWNRSGSAPEVDEAWFESSDGTSWQFLAQASRVTEGWEATGLSLPQDGLIRARGRSAGGNDSGSSTVITEMLSFGQPAVPDIAAETSNGAALQPLDVIDLGGVDWQATSPPHLITIRNSGNNTLSGLAVRVGGVDAGKFIVGSLGATSLAPGASTTLSVAFAPSTGGEKHALVSILSNDPDEPVFEIGLKGTGLHSDPNFNPTMLGAARYALPLSDGRIIVGGWNYSPDSFEPVGTVVRLLMDGSVDPSFHPPSTVPSSCAAVLPDGKILVGGLTGLVRLLPDGAIDPSFGGPVFPLPTAFVIHSAAINLIVPQPDGRILIGGTFGSIHGSSRNLVARLHPDGSLDTSFDAHLGTDWYPSVDGLLVLPDSRILVSGHFSTDGALSHANLVRLQPDGSLDESFAYSLANWASKIALQPDGKILSVGYILPGTYLKRHNADGSLDGTFAPIVNDYVNSMAVAADGKIVIGGVFTEVNGTYCNRIARLNPDGTLDPAFAPDANGEVYSVALQPDGQVLIGGTFTRVGGRDHAYVARIPNNISSQSTVTLDGMGGVDWTRDGSAPEIELAAFERWNGNTWTWVGTPDRIANGWTATGLSLPQAGWIRARGLARSGQTNGSESSIEDVVAYPDPVSAWRFLHFGTITETGNAADLLDPDMDGLVNKLERVLNRDPNRPTPHPLHLQPNGDQLVCTYTRSSAAYREGTIFEIRWSDNLVDWFTTGVTQVILSDDGLDQLVRVTISAPLQGRRFVQLMAQ